MPDDFNVTLSADVSELTGAFEEARSSGEETAEALKGAFEDGGSGMEESFAGMGEAMEGLGEKSKGLLENISKMTEGWAGLASVMGAGAVAELMNKVAETTMEVGDSLRMTSGVLQVSASDARGFNEAMSSLGVSSTAAMLAVRSLSVDAVNGGKKLHELGISAKDAAGQFKPGIELFQETIDKLNGIADPAERADLAQQMLGRSGRQLLSVLDQINPTLEESIAAQEKNGAANQAAADQSLALHKALTELKSAWEDAIINMAPAVVAALNAITAAAKAATAAMAALAAADTKFWDEQSKRDQANLDKKWASMHDPLATGQGLTSSYADSPMSMGTEQAYSLTEGLKRGLTIQEKLKMEGQAYADQVDRAANTLKDTVVTLPGKKGGGHKGKGGGADPMAGLENQLDTADQKMDKMAQQFQKLGSEAQMAGKVSTESFAQLSAQAQADFAIMQQRHKEFTTAVEAGSKDAAKQAEAAWKLSAQKFEEDWHQAAEKAKQDMQQVKSVADQMAGDVSGILNQAISGKVNWAQEFQKILSQMLDHLIKHLAQQLAMWLANTAQVNAIKQAGAAEGLAQQKAANAVAGTSDAVTAAKGAYASASQVPYIGWILGPIAAAAAFAGVEAFGSAEGGFDVPPGVSPITQLHPREMVLPAQHSDTIRRLGDYMGGAGGGGDSSTHNWNIQSLDPSSLVDIVRNNQRVFASAVAGARRSGMQFNTG